MNPESPGSSFHKLKNAKDKNFWSVRVNDDIRLIVHRTESDLLCYVDHHDKAYAWAERRKLETHPRTGAAQLIEIKETIKEIQECIGAVTHYGDLEEIYNTERHLLYVSCTRAGDYLLVTGVKPESELLDDMMMIKKEQV